MTTPDPEQIAAGLSEAHNALDRMKRASDRGTGCHLTAAMIAELRLTFLGEIWDEARPQHREGPTQ